MDDSCEARPLVVTVREAARLLAVSERTVFRLIKDGRLPAVRVTADTTRIRVADLSQLLGQ